jgi:hypothetical protein
MRAGWCIPGSPGWSPPPCYPCSRRPGRVGAGQRREEAPTARRTCGSQPRPVGRAGEGESLSRRLAHGWQWLHGRHGRHGGHGGHGRQRWPVPATARAQARPAGASPADHAEDRAEAGRCQLCRSFQFELGQQWPLGMGLGHGYQGRTALQGDEGLLPHPYPRGWESISPTGGDIWRQRKWLEEKLGRCGRSPTTHGGLAYDILRFVRGPQRCNQCKNHRLAHALAYYSPLAPTR